MIKLMTLAAVLSTLAFSLVLNGCTKTDPKAQAQSEALSSETPPSEATVSSAHQNSAKKAEQTQPITSSTLDNSCKHLDLKSLTGFTEGTIEARCQPVKDFHLKQFKCSVSENAFGAELDAIVLKTDQQAVFAYSSSTDCQHAVEIRNANE